MDKIIKERFVKGHQLRKEQVSGLIVHYISAINVTPADPFNLDKIIEIFNTYGVSADFMIDRDGTIYRLVPKTDFSYHAGVSEYPDGVTNVSAKGVRCLNAVTMGVELIGIHAQPFTDAQYESLVWLTQHVKANEHPTLDYGRLYGHNEVATPLGRKIDPGPSFDWTRFKAALGILNQPAIETPVEAPAAPTESSSTVSNIGKAISFILTLLGKR